MSAISLNFRLRLTSRERLFGTFVKTPTTHATEILGAVGYDFVIIDEEHSPFDRAAIDLIALAARASNIAALVRVRDPEPGNILSVLDCGCTGVLVPHVSSAEKARAIAAACRYRNGIRGFSNTTRAGGYGRSSIASHLAEQDALVTCVAMIEDPSAVEEIDAIAAVEGIDAFFIGRGDLTVSLGGTSITSPVTQQAVEKIAAAAARANKPVIILPTGPEDAQRMSALGATGFVIANDQGFLQRAAKQSLTEFSAALG